LQAYDEGAYYKALCTHCRPMMREHIYYPFCLAYAYVHVCLVQLMWCLAGLYQLNKCRCRCTLIVPLLTQLYKQVLVTERGRGQGAAEVTSIGALLIFFFFKHSFPVHWSHLILPLIGPSRPHLCFCLHTRVWLLCFIWTMSKERKSLWSYER